MSERESASDHYLFTVNELPRTRKSELGISPASERESNKLRIKKARLGALSIEAKST